MQIFKHNTTPTAALPSLFDDAAYRAAVEALADTQHKYLAAQRAYEDEVCPPRGGPVNHAKATACHKDLKRLAGEIEAARRVVDAERTRASATVCERLEPYHRDLAVRMAAAIVALGHLVEEERAFSEGLHAQNVIRADTLPALTVASLALPSRDYSPLAVWLHTAAKAGLISASVIPAAWRAQWSFPK